MKAVGFRASMAALKLEAWPTDWEARWEAGDFPAGALPRPELLAIWCHQVESLASPWNPVRAPRTNLAAMTSFYSCT